MPESMKVIDLHGKNCFQAEKMIEAALRKSYGLYRIRLIHGFHSGVSLKNFIWDNYGNDPRILRISAFNAGSTDLILREL